jgi:outer membrane protein assembly factor BamB
MNIFKKERLRWGALGVLTAVFLLMPLACGRDKEPPVVTITAPSDGETVSGYVTITIKAEDDDSVASVSLILDDSSAGTLYQPPWEFEWNTLELEEGSTHTIKATALDPSDNEGESEPVTVTVMQPSNPPNTPGVPEGPSAGFVGDALTFRATTTDPDGDDISYQFDWGDETKSAWTDYVTSGEEMEAQKTFDTEGTYTIKVRAKDTYGVTSAFSPGLTVVISPVSSTGSIQVNSVPTGAEIWLDGTNTGKTTNALLDKIAPGERTVSLRKESYADYQTTVTVVAEQTAEVNATLEAIGELIWSYETGGEIESSPAIGSDGTIYVGSSDSKLYAITSTGGLYKDYTTDFAVRSSPAVGSDGKIYFGSDDVYVYALHPDVVRYWAYKTEGYVSSSPAIGSDGTIYAGSGDDNLWALTSDGKFKWKYNTGGDVASSPAIGGDGTIYVGSDDGSLYAINPDMTLKWSCKTGAKVQSSPAVGSDGTIYFGSQDGYVYALDPADGNPKWSHKTDGKVNSSPAIGSDGTIYVGSDDNYLYALNPADGSVKWSYETGGFVRSSPAVGANGTVYFGSVDGYIYAVRSDGTLKWRYETAGSVITSSPAIGADGTIYCGSTDRYIYALSSDSPGLASSPWPKFCHDNRNTGRAGP